MQPSSSDTLDIKPLVPGGSIPHPDFQVTPAEQPATEPAVSEHVAPSANDPVAAAQARVALASMPASQPRRLPKAPQPVSPLEEEQRRQNPRNLPQLPRRIKPLLSAAASFLLLLLVFKMPVIYSQLQYQAHQNQAVITGPTTTSNAPVGPDPTITIPKINVNAPVQYINSTQESDIQTALENGIVHYATTPVPGAGGNAVFVGHSSNDLWEPGNYKFVFVLLDKLVPGDQFSLNYNSVKYVYQVTSVQVVAPTDLAVLDPTTQAQVTLITCTPPGTSWQRLVVVAKQISPDPNKPVNKPTSTSGQSNSTLPGSSPSFFDELKQAWHAVFGGGQSPQPTQPQNTNSLPSGL